MDSMILNLIEEEADTEFLRVVGYDDCVIGSCENGDHFVLVYSIDAIVEKLMKEIDSDYNEAYEYFEYNIRGSKFGPRTSTCILLAMTP